jgi:hypothetical protein
MSVLMTSRKSTFLPWKRMRAKAKATIELEATVATMSMQATMKVF